MIFTNTYLQVLIKEEYEIYTIENFVAEVGGYLGLLLGASILSIVESSTVIIGKMFEKLN